MFQDCGQELVCQPSSHLEIYTYKRESGWGRTLHKVGSGYDGKQDPFKDCCMGFKRA